MNPPARISVIGAQVSACDAPAALELLGQRLEQGGGGYVCFTNAHAAVMCRDDSRFRAVTAGSFLSVADGMPVYWAGRARGAPIGHVPGPDFIMHALRRYPQRRHFFYGATPATLAALVQALRQQIPGVQICGAISPPFRVLTPAEAAANLQAINDAHPEFIWVGLGAPKQELWMADNWQALQPAILFGVGAAFDFHAGTVARAPKLLRALGLEWLHRLLQEPRRLWRRYVITNSLFIWYAVVDLLRSAVQRTPRS